MIKKILLILCTLSPTFAYATGLQIMVEVPKLNVAEYHAPYTAMWLESADRDKKFTKTLSVWYDQKKKNNEGQKWLKDLRQWWRRDGRDLQMPVDGVASATRLTGTHQLNFTLGQAPLLELSQGNYILFVEMSREVGGRELVQVPFVWPVDAVTTITAKGSSEVGVINLVLNP